MVREQFHNLTEQREKAILVLLPEPKENWQEEDLYQELCMQFCVCIREFRI